MEHQYVIINDTGDLIQCRGIYPYHEAIGHLICLFTDQLDQWYENGYELTHREDFVELEGSTGFGWFATLTYKNNKPIKENWYILEISEDEIGIKI